MRIAEVVVLVRAVVDAKSRADRCPSVGAAGHPRQAQTRRKIIPIGRIHRRAGRAEAATGEVDDGNMVARLAHHRVILVPHTQIEGKVRTNLELILSVSHPERPAHLADSQDIIHTDRIDSILHEIVRTVERNGRQGDAGARVVQ